MQNPVPTRHRGMTLVELMIGILVLSVLMGLAIPSFNGYIAGSQTTAANNSLVTAFALARSDALGHSTIAGVCPSSDLATCTGGNNWAAGWIAYRDTNENGTVDADELIQSWPPLGAGTVATSAGAGAVIYNSQGSRPLPSVIVTITITPPHCSGVRQGQVVVNVGGGVRSGKVACP